jgi:hypothetical protein
VFERTRFSNQPVDDVPIINAVFAPATQSGQFLDFAIAIPNFNRVGLNSSLDDRADQPAVDRICISVDVDQTSWRHSDALAAHGVEPPLGQWSKPR